MDLIMIKFKILKMYIMYFKNLVIHQVRPKSNLMKSHVFLVWPYFYVFFPKFYWFKCMAIFLFCFSLLFLFGFALCPLLWLHPLLWWTACLRVRSHSSLPNHQLDYYYLNSSNKRNGRIRYKHFHCLIDVLFSANHRQYLGNSLTRFDTFKIHVCHITVNVLMLCFTLSGLIN